MTVANITVLKYMGDRAFRRLTIAPIERAINNDEECSLSYFLNEKKDNPGLVMKDELALCLAKPQETDKN